MLSCETFQKSSASKDSAEIEESLDSINEIDQIDLPDASRDVIQVDTLLKDSSKISRDSF